MICSELGRQGYDSGDDDPGGEGLTDTFEQDRGGPDERCEINQC
jgi:hypothetical protein